MPISGKAKGRIANKQAIRWDPSVVGGPSTLGQFTITYYPLMKPSLENGVTGRCPHNPLSH